MVTSIRLLKLDEMHFETTKSIEFSRFRSEAKLPWSHFTSAATLSGRGFCVKQMGISLQTDPWVWEIVSHQCMWGLLSGFAFACICIARTIKVKHKEWECEYKSFRCSIAQRFFLGFLLPSCLVVWLASLMKDNVLLLTSLMMWNFILFIIMPSIIHTWILHVLNHPKKFVCGWSLHLNLIQCVARSAAGQISTVAFLTTVFVSLKSLTMSPWRRLNLQLRAIIIVLSFASFPLVTLFQSRCMLSRLDDYLIWFYYSDDVQEQNLSVLLDSVLVECVSRLSVSSGKTKKDHVHAVLCHFVATRLRWWCIQVRINCKHYFVAPQSFQMISSCWYLD